MFCLLVIFSVLGFAVAEPNGLSGQRIVGGELTTIDQYPFTAVLLMGYEPYYTYVLQCGATILNARSILTAAHCFRWSNFPINYRIRVGSSYTNSEGTVHNVPEFIFHPNYDIRNLDSDVAIVRSDSIIVFSNVVQPAMISGAGYVLEDNQPVVALGWGRITYGGEVSEQLRRVQIYTINQAICRQRYMELGDEVTNNMLCSGVLDVGGRDQCNYDSGGPLLHNGVVVGVCSWGEECALPRYPGVNARVSRLTSWIQANA